MSVPPTSPQIEYQARETLPYKNLRDIPLFHNQTCIIYRTQNVFKFRRISHKLISRYVSLGYQLWFNSLGDASSTHMTYKVNRTWHPFQRYYEYNNMVNTFEPQYWVYLWRLPSSFPHRTVLPTMFTCTEPETCNSMVFSIMSHITYDSFHPDPLRHDKGTFPCITTLLHILELKMIW